MDFEAFFAARLDAIEREGRYRRFADIERLRGRFPQALYREAPDAVPIEVTLWCSNDYLSLSEHPAILAAMQEALDRSGAGAGGTRNISGTSHDLVRLERRLAAWHGKPAALVFGSGYAANLASLSALGRQIPDLVIFSDAENHASMIAGIRDARAEYRIFRHNDVAHLESLLKESGSRPKLIACESLYSMSGDIAPLADLVTCARRHGALLYLDEVHAVGLYGPEGAGIAARDGLAQEIDIIQGTLAKAIGQIGGYIAASARLVDFVRSTASAFIFTTALPPMIAAGAHAAIDLIAGADDLRRRQRDSVAAMRRALRQRGLPDIANDSHIVPVPIGDAALCREIARRLLAEGRAYVQPINYPTVARGEERLRLTPGPAHQPAAIDDFADSLARIWGDLGRTQEIR